MSSLAPPSSSPAPAPEERHLTSSPCTFSVVIAWVNPRDLLDPVLDALDQQARRAEEIIVATRHDATLVQGLRRTRPNVTVLPAPAGTTIPALRSMGIKQSHGRIVVVTEDHCIPHPDWLRAVERRVAEAWDVLCGPVENACRHRWRDWAAFLTEYAGAIRPVTETAVAQLPSNNAAYRRKLLDDLCTVLDRDLWESFYYQDLAERGIAVACVPEMLVQHRRPFDFCYFVRQRYHYGRSFAGMRRRFFTRFTRLAYAAGTVLLPAVLLLRNLHTLVRKRRLVGHYLLCFPLIAIYLTAGALGEMIGYLFGGGRSLEKVE